MFKPVRATFFRLAIAMALAGPAAIVAAPDGASLARAASGATPKPAPVPTGAALRNRKPAADWRSSHGGWTVWSDAIGDRYRLFARRGSTTKLLSAPPSAVTHDPGAGVGPTGRPSAVYQRCTGMVCSMWLVDLATGRQRRVANLGVIRRETTAASTEEETWRETHPRIWGSRVAFKTGRSAPRRPSLRVGPSAAGRGAVKTLRTDPGDDGVQLEQLAVGPKHVVALWADDFCFGRCKGLYIYGVASGRQALIDDARGTGACVAYLNAVRFDGRAFRWTRDLEAKTTTYTLAIAAATRRP